MEKGEHILFFSHVRYSQCCRLWHEVYMLDKIIEANESNSNKLYVMYDILCSVQSFLKVSEICIIFILIIWFHY